MPKSYGMLCRSGQVGFTAQWGVPSQDTTITRQLEQFGANLRRERDNRKITQEALAVAADLNIRTVQKIEAGQTNILLTTVLRLQKAVGCKWDVLMLTDG